MSSWVGAIGMQDAITAYINGEIDDEGSPEWRTKAIAAMGKLRPVMGALTKLPLGGGYDTGKIIMNLSGMEGDIGEMIADDLKSMDADADITEPRNRIWAALREDNDTELLIALTEPTKTSPKRLNIRTLKGVIDGKFRNLARLERTIAESQGRLRLAPGPAQWVKDQQARRQKLYVGMAEMIRRNQGAFKDILRAAAQTAP